MAGILFASPWFIGFLIFTIGPLIVSLMMSFCWYDVLNPPKFIGVQNFRNMIEDSLFWKSLYNTFYITVIGVPIRMVGALLVALLLNTNVKGLAFFRTAFYLPSITPVVAGAILWSWILNGQYGLLNILLRYLGISGPAWLTDPAWSKMAIILMQAWSLGGDMIIYLAGLQGIPSQFYEAARIDGARGWTIFIRITLPLLTPALFFTLVMNVIHTLQIFAQAYIMTQGGPVNSTLFYVYYLFNHAFLYFKMGYASALAWILFIVILIITLIQLRISKLWVYYEADEKVR